MAGFSSPLRLAPPMTPRRAPSPTMSPGGRRGRTLGSSEESRLRDLSPDTTLRAFTQRPIPFDTSCDEYKVYSCIASLTAAERDLGARVAKAAQQLRSWCTEIEQWGWSGSFEPPSEENREKRRRSLELRIREHMGDADLSSMLSPLEYWGSLLSVEVEQHEARLDNIEEELLKLDVDELKEHVLDMHPASRSRPASSGYGATRQNYKPMDDFSFLITQTLLSALPHHAQLKERLGTWTARVSTLRQVPRYLDGLKTAEKAMQLGWNAIEPPADTSDAASKQWKEAIDTISSVLRDKVSDLGKQLDGMLDALEGRDDCIPERWIDVFESVEADYGRWVHESRRQIIEFDVRRKWEQNSAAKKSIISPLSGEHSTSVPASQRDFDLIDSSDTRQNLSGIKATSSTRKHDPPVVITAAHPHLTPTATEVTEDDSVLRTHTPSASDETANLENAHRPDETRVPDIPATEYPLAVEPAATVQEQIATPIVSKFSTISSPPSSAKRAKPWFFTDSVADEEITSYREQDEVAAEQDPSLNVVAEANNHAQLDPGNTIPSFESHDDLTYSIPDDNSEFDEGDTVIHNDFDDVDTEPIEQATVAARYPVQSVETAGRNIPSLVLPHKRTESVMHNPVLIAGNSDGNPGNEPPQTPRSRRNSTDSMSSDVSFDSSPPTTIEDSPSVRNTANRALKAPRPELNAAMSKRRAGKVVKDSSSTNPPWPPSQFTQNANNSAEDLERKISDILTTIPAHIRLTSGPGADAPEVKSSRSVSARGSRGYLRAARSVSGLKSPELTLSPAKSDFDLGGGATGRRSVAARNDNDIKLYHLTQPGKEQPVKLFIRRVGENGERVMVRVGGGWADLGEYLRQYAEHHGRRTASDGKFEILGLEVKNSDPMTSPNRPESVMSRGDRRFSGNFQPTSPTTPVKTSGKAYANEEAPPKFASPPGVTDDANVPSTNSSQRSWQGNEVGLAGPNTKKLDLSGDKLEWIEGMMKQARTVSGTIVPLSHTPAQREERTETRSDSRSDSRTGIARKTEFADLGKVGGTKRIFLRGGRPTYE